MGSEFTRILSGTVMSESGMTWIVPLNPGYGNGRIKYEIWEWENGL